MEVLGYSFSILSLVQIGTTTLIVAIFATFTSLGEHRANHQSGWQMSLLVSFVLQEHPHLRSLPQIVDLQEEDLKSGDDHLRYFAERFEKFREDGSLPDIRTFPETNLLEHIFLIALSPLLIIFLISLMVSHRKRRVYRVLNTEVRKNYFSKLVLFVVGGIGYFLIGAAILPFSKIAGMLLLGLVAIVVLGVIVAVLMLSYEQQSWKSYWGDRLLEIQAAQDREEAHDQFNRALLLSNFIAEQPDVPFPGRLGLYTGIYSVVQGLILLVNNQLGG